MSAVLAPAAKPAAPLPRDLEGFRDWHAGETLIVCGCGQSLKDLAQPERFVTIGVNDVGRQFTPDYLLVVNTRAQFAAGRFDAVANSQARALFTHLELGVRHPHVVRFALGRRAGTDFRQPGVLHYTRNSPYPALCLALLMGARRIGLIGVDFTPGHFFGDTGVHPLARELAQIDAEYRKLNEVCESAGIEIVNLSPISRLTAFRKQTVAEFEAANARPAPGTSPLRVVSYATTPVAGVPGVLARAIAHHTPHPCRTVWATHGYGNGVVFERDVEYEWEPAQALALLEAADVVVVHNGKVAPRHESLLRSKPVVTLAHNYLWNVDTRFVDAGYPGLVVGQYQATLAEFAGWTPVPNPIPIWEASHMPPAAPRGGPVTICFAPSGTHERYPAGHRLYWHAKGYDTTMTALDALSRSHGVRLEVTRGRQVSHREAMAMKQRSHIVIDECITGSYHRTSLEGLAVGAVVVNGIGQLAGVAEVLRTCADGATEMPFVAAGPQDLLQVLTGLVERGPLQLHQDGAAGRQWMERHWRFEDQWARWWKPAMERAMAWHGRHALPARAATPRPSPVRGVVHDFRRSAPAPSEPRLASPAAAPAAKAQRAWLPGITAVVPFAGADRLPLLRAVLHSLRAQGLAQVLVVECDTSACAQATAMAEGATHLFVFNAAGFHKALALNTGALQAQTEWVLWWDADLLAPAGFVAQTREAVQRRQLDYLVPWSRVAHLDDHQTQAALAQPSHDTLAAPLRTVYSRHGARGGMGLLKRSFFAEHGGACQEFLGSDSLMDAYFHKAALFGRAGIADDDAPRVRQLFHAGSRRLGARAGSTADPHRSHDEALLRRMRTIGSRERYLREFPEAPPLACPDQPAGSPDTSEAVLACPPAQPGADVLGVLQLGPGDAHATESIESLLPLCDRVLLFDEGADPAALRRCTDVSARVLTLKAPPGRRDATRDKNAVLRAIERLSPGWVLWLGRGEVLERTGAARLRTLIQQPDAAPAYALRLAYLRGDGQPTSSSLAPERQARPSLFRFRGQPVHRFVFPPPTPGAPVLGYVPRGVARAAVDCGVRLEQHGPLHPDADVEALGLPRPGQTSPAEPRHG